MKHQNPKKGAVAYLNMLPYFAFSKNITLFKSPRELNDAARNGQVTQACMSAIAGIQADFRPTSPLMGIGARRHVQSVYLEPIALSPEDTEFWSKIQEQNAGGLAHVVPHHGSFRAPQKVIHMLSTGTSEHSEWVFRTLLQVQGFRCQVHRVPQAWGLKSFAELRHAAKDLVGNEKCALLVIGDPALAREALFPCAAAENLRFDLAEFWFSFSQLPCVFAVWFDTQNLPCDTVSKSNDLPLVESLKMWKSTPDFQKGQIVESFLRKHSASAEILLNSTPMESLLAYLDNIEFIFDDEFEKTLHTYQQLYPLFN
jgi:predicted solute-binding protein